jgi:DNA anti-recombination protein RmuC
MTEKFQKIFSEVGEIIESIKKIDDSNKIDESIEEIWRKFRRKLEQRNRRINRLNDLSNKIVEIEPVFVLLNRFIGEILRGFLLP